MLSTRVLNFITGISGCLLLGRLFDFAALRIGAFALFFLLKIILFCWMIHDIQAVKLMYEKPEQRAVAKNNVVLEFVGISIAVAAFVFLGGL